MIGSGRFWSFWVGYCWFCLIVFKISHCNALLIRSQIINAYCLCFERFQRLISCPWQNKCISFKCYFLEKVPIGFRVCLQYHCHKLGLLAETNLKEIYCWKLHRLPKTKLKQCFPLFVAIRNKRFDFDWMSDCLIDWKLCECQKHFF